LVPRQYLVEQWAHGRSGGHGAFIWRPANSVAGKSAWYISQPYHSFRPSATDNLLTSGLRNNTADVSAPAIATFTGILTDPQFRVVLHALEQRDGADLLSAPKVTTLSGRQTQIQVVDVRSIVVGNQTQFGGGGGGGVGVGVGGIGLGTPTGQPGGFQPQTASVPLGPILDVVPYVSADGYSI